MSEFRVKFFSVSPYLSCLITQPVLIVIILGVLFSGKQLHKDIAGNCTKLFYRSRKLRNISKNLGIFVHRPNIFNLRHSIVTLIIILIALHLSLSIVRVHYHTEMNNLKIKPFLQGLFSTSFDDSINILRDFGC